jgi:hypothetical protein
MHSQQGNVQIARGDGLTLIADAMNGDNPAAFHKKP